MTNLNNHINPTNTNLTEIKVGTVMQVTIKSLALTGKGVGMVRVGKFNRPVFISYTAPGDVCRVKITKQEKQYYEADLIEVIKESDVRIKPPCEHYTFCGGCNMLHIKYDEQLKLKKEMLEFVFKRSNFTYPEINVIPAKNEYFYREKIRITKKGKLGFYRPKSDEITKIKKCHIINNKFNEAFPRLAKKVQFGETTLIHDSESDDIITPGEDRYASYKYRDIKFNFATDSFIQSNLATNEILIDTLLNHIRGDNILDLYSGLGNFTLPIAKIAKKVTAVEGNGNAVKLLIKNAKNNGISNVRGLCDDALNYIMSTEKKYDTVVLDPPRAGICHTKAVPKLANMSNKIIYVSCNPEALIKDLKLLKGFKIKSIDLIDMFPQTNHFELIVVLEK